MIDDRIDKEIHFTPFLKKKTYVNMGMRVKKSKKLCRLNKRNR